MNMSLNLGQKSLAFVVVFVLLFTPFIGFAQPTFVGEVVPECGGLDTNNDGKIDVTNICGYCDLVKLGERVVEFLIFIAIIIAILMIIYGGSMYLTAGGDTGKVAKGHSVFRSAIFGLVLVLASWLIISTILVMLGYKDTIASALTLPGCG